MLLVLAAAGGLRGYCPMTVVSAALAGTGDPHACCKAGMSGRLPGCCHADLAPSAAATVKAPAAAVPIPTTSHWDLLEPAVAVASVPAVLPTYSHSPPPLVLRI